MAELFSYLLIVICFSLQMNGVDINSMEVLTLVRNDRHVIYIMLNIIWIIRLLIYKRASPHSLLDEIMGYFNTFLFINILISPEYPRSRTQPTSSYLINNSTCFILFIAFFSIRQNKQQRMNGPLTLRVALSFLPLPMHVRFFGRKYQFMDQLI